MPSQPLPNAVRYKLLDAHARHRLRATRVAATALLAAATSTAACGSSTGGPSDPRAPDGVPAIDPQVVQDQDDMTWDDYRPIPDRNWADTTLVPTRRQFKVALVAIDFPDQPFVITLPKGSDPFGNPQIDPIPREQVPRFYADFYNTPSELNHGQTINGYWMEQSRGQIGIGKIDAYGPYRMPRNLFEYGLNEFDQEGGVPAGYTADVRMEPHADSLWREDTGNPDIRDEYDFVLRIYAGYDETTVWQEFGEMKFQTRNDITPEFGNPDPTKPDWVTTRYIDWTSWLAGAQQWGQSTVRQGESSGTITHEIAHLAFRIGDNNNNPYVEPYRRVASGPWDIMDRGSFNGPGGPHRRWVIPAQEGASMPAGLMLRSKMMLDFVSDDQVLRLNRNGLAGSGLAVAVVMARAVEPVPGAYAGIRVNLDGPEPHDRTPPDDMNANPLSAGLPTYDYYSVEVVQRIGYDSFTPDNGVLIAKNREDPERNACGDGYRCFTWVIDARPEDIGMIDFHRPNGEPVMRTIADYRQLNDALFHAGSNSGSEYEWRDPYNRLHFYVIDLQTDDRGIRSYTIGVRSLDGAGPHTRGVEVAGPAAPQPEGDQLTCRFTVRNTGTARPIDSGLHPQDATAAVGYDIYRLETEASGTEATPYLRNSLVAVPFGGATPVLVYLGRIGRPVGTMRVQARAAGAGGAAMRARIPAVIALTATSESDPTKTAAARCEL